MLPVLWHLEHGSAKTVGEPSGVMMDTSGFRTKIPVPFRVLFHSIHSALPKPPHLNTTTTHWEPPARLATVLTLPLEQLRVL